MQRGVNMLIKQLTWITMDKTIDISWFDLSLGYILLLFPILIFLYFKIRLIKETLIAAFRMTIQLLLVGIYLGYLFKWDNVFINIGWVIVMIVAASFTVVKRSSLSLKLYFVPVLFGLLISVLLVDFYFLTFVIKPEPLLTARYIIPITGMLIGNTMKSNIIVLNSFYSLLKKNLSFYYYAIGNGATRKEALSPFYKIALKQGINPNIATMAIVGLISLPGMMTGQILGGNDPSLAVRYQIVIMISVFVIASISAVMSLTITNKFVFDELGRPKQEVLEVE